MTANKETTRFRKIKAGIVSGALASMLAVGGAIAYLYDTASLTNEFTIAQVGDGTGEVGASAFALSLTEPSFVADNAKDVLPGQEIAKDPTVRNMGRLPQYSFVKVTIPQVEINGISQDLFTYTVNDGWTAIGWDDEDGAKSVIYEADNVLAMGESLTLFDKVTAAHFDADDNVATDQQIVVTALAVQTEGFADSNAAYVATHTALRNA